MLVYCHTKGPQYISRVIDDRVVCTNGRLALRCTLVGNGHISNICHKVEVHLTDNFPRRDQFWCTFGIESLNCRSVHRYCLLQWGWLVIPGVRCGRKLFPTSWKTMEKSRWNRLKIMLPGQRVAADGFVDIRGQLDGPDLEML